MEEQRITGKVHAYRVIGVPAAADRAPVVMQTQNCEKACETEVKSTAAQEPAEIASPVQHILRVRDRETRERYGLANYRQHPMHPTPTWAVYRDAKTGQLVRKYIASGEAKSAQQETVQLKTQHP